MKRLYEPLAYAAEPDAGNYWQSVSPPEPERYLPLRGRRKADVVVIGAGITGLSAARRLAEAGRETVVLEAAWPAWGASGRAGGFVCLGGAMLDQKTMIRRHGRAETQAFHAFQRAGIEETAAFIEARGVDVGRHSDGEWLLAHRLGRIDALRAEVEHIRETYGLEARFHDRDALAARGLAGPEFHAGVHLPLGFAIDPRRYALARLAAAVEAGVAIHGGSLVRHVAPRGGSVLVETDAGAIEADQAIIAVNGYGAEQWIPELDGVTMPVLSHVLVTRPLSAGELAAQGWASPDMAYDSRRLLHYFRLMPDGRFLFGMRGGVSASAASLRASARRARRDFERMFPAWRHVETPYSWQGLVCLTASLTPFVGPLGESGRLFSAFGYHGNGLAFSAKAGRAVAELALGEIAPGALPAPLRGPLRRFPFAAVRRLALRAAYLGFAVEDRFM